MTPDTRDDQLDAWHLLDEVAEALGLTDGGNEWDRTELLEQAKIAGEMLAITQRRMQPLIEAVLDLDPDTLKASQPVATDGWQMPEGHEHNWRADPIVPYRWHCECGLRMEVTG